MRKFFIFSIIVTVLSCTNSKQPDKEVAKPIVSEIKEVNESDSTILIGKYDNLFNSIKEELTSNLIGQPETYKALNWGHVEIMENPIFKYRISHSFLCANLSFRPYDTGVGEYEMYFHLDSAGKIVASSLIEDYREYYSQDGQFKVMFSNFELEKIGRDNSIDMLFTNSKTLAVVSERIPFFKGKVGMTKNEFQRVNFQKLEKNILSDIDTVNFGVYEAGGDDIQFIFENDTIVEIK